MLKEIRSASRTRTPRERKRFGWIALGLALAVGIVYGQVVGHGFVEYDDNVYMTENIRSQTGLTLEGIKWAFTAPRFSDWHPLTWLSHMADAELFGLNPGAHHFTSLIVHAVNALLLLWVLWRMTGELFPSSVVACLFAIHPLNVESVAWISERKNVLNMFFWLLTLWGYARYTERPGGIRYGVVLLVFILGVMTKPMIVTLPVVLLLLDYWPLRRWPLASDPRRWARIWLLAAEKLPLFALSMVLSAVAVWSQAQIGALKTLEAFPLEVRIGNALHAYLAYISKLVWPVGLSAFYPHPEHSLPLWKVMAAGAVVMLVSSLVINGCRRAPYALTGWLWYLVTLLPMIGLIQVGSQAGADRYMYVPAVGLFVILAWGLEGRMGGAFLNRSAAAAGIGLVLVALALVSRQQVAHWRNSETLFIHMLAVDPGNYLAHSGLGLELARKGRTAEAIVHFRQAVRLKPDYARAYNNLGNALTAQGNAAEAIKAYEKAIFFDPHNAKAHNNLGVARAVGGDLADAVFHFHQAVGIYPDYVKARRNLARALADLGDLSAARHQREEADRIERGGRRSAAPSPP